MEDVLTRPRWNMARLKLSSAVTPGFFCTILLWRTRSGMDKWVDGCFLGGWLLRVRTVPPPCYPSLLPPLRWGGGVFVSWTPAAAYAVPFNKARDTHTDTHTTHEETYLFYHPPSLLVGGRRKAGVAFPLIHPA